MSNSYYQLSPTLLICNTELLIDLIMNELINVDDTNELPNVVSRRTRKCYPWASIATVS